MTAASQDLWKEIEEQRKACDAIIQSKDSLITHIKKELKVKDNDFTKLLKQQAEDVNTLLAKMNEQIDSMSKACRCACADTFQKRCAKSVNRGS